MKNMFANVCLVLVSCAAGLALCEVSLWLFYPKYRYLAEAPFRFDAMRIWTSTPNSRSWRNHPDTFVTHSLHHNNLALRQHRDFSEADLAAATNIGVFGASFTENAGMPVQYSFTEPLDYLLNQRGKRFNVLNFGVAGYGPGQSALHYEYFRHASDLDHVFYVYSRRDLRNLYATRLFHLDEAGHLERDEAIWESWWGPLMRRLHIPYLVLDVSGRLSPFLMEINALREDLELRWKIRRSDETSQALLTALRQGRLVHDDQKNTLEIFRQLIRRWKHLAEHNGSTFSVVLLPAYPPQPFVVDLLDAEDVEVLDLYDCFGNLDPAHTQRSWGQSPYRFKYNRHWNEAGNQLAAVCLYRVLEEKTGLPRLSEGRLQDTLFQYYAAFGDNIFLKPEAGLGGGRAERSVPFETSAAIRKKYLALDLDVPSNEEITKLVASPDKRVIASVFDVYLGNAHLIYVKEDCQPTDLTAPFFLHIVPDDIQHLPLHRFKYGFENRDFRPPISKIDDKTCQWIRRLPAYPIRQVRTGQHVKDTQDNYVHLWEGEFSMAQGAGGRD